MKSLLVSALLAFVLQPLFAAVAPDALVPLARGKLELVPSFEACSYYFRPVGEAARSYVVDFRRVGEERWRRAFEPVSDLPVGMWKGSIFDLQEATAWQLRVLTPTGAEVFPPTEFRTWSSQPPIAKVIDLSKLVPTAGGLVISDQGTPQGWIKYTAPRDWRFEAAHAPAGAVAAITFRGARCVILENVTIVGGARHAVLVEESDSVRILNCDLAGWGRVGVQQFTNTGTRGKYADAQGELINYDGGIKIDRSARTVVERCYVHDPRHRANSWMFSHPAGPAALFVTASRGGTVVRWNDFVGSDEHRWNDVIEASNNGTADGGFFRDSDISGNFIAFGNDDGVELEGGGMNVRFYRNKIEGTTCGISTAACILGPQFIFGNLVTNPGDEAGLALWFFKNSHGAEQSGKRHFINNTLVGAMPGAYGSYGKAVGTGRIGFMRNNVFVCSDARLPGEWARRDDFETDLFWAGNSEASAQAFLGTFRKFGQEKGGVALAPRFVRAEEGDFHLAANSPARGKASAVANVVEAGTNLGAFADEATEVPFRPLALTAVPRQLDFAAPKRTAQMEVTVSVPATASEAVPFEIRKNRVFTWFNVEPATGSVAPGKSVTLTVTVDAAALHGRPRFKGAFLVRTPTGLSRPVSVYATADFREDLRPAAAPDALYLASAGAGPEVAAKFTLPRAGAYSLLARAAVRGDVMPKRGFDVALDGAVTPTKVAINTDYQWNTGATNSRVIYLQALGELAAGEHQLRVRLASGELDVKEYIVTDHPAAFFIDDWQKERN